MKRPSLAVCALRREDLDLSGRLMRCLTGSMISYGLLRKAEKNAFGIKLNGEVIFPVVGALIFVFPSS